MIYCKYRCLIDVGFYIHSISKSSYYRCWLILYSSLRQHHSSLRLSEQTGWHRRPQADTMVNKQHQWSTNSINGQQTASMVNGQQTAFRPVSVCPGEQSKRREITTYELIIQQRFRMYVRISLIREICRTLPLSSGRKVRHSILQFTHSPSDITGHVVVSCVVSCRVSRRVVSHHVVSCRRLTIDASVSCLFSRHHRWRMHIDSTPKRPVIYRSNLFQTQNTSKVEYIILLLYTLQQCDKFFR